MFANRSNHMIRLLILLLIALGLSSCSMLEGQTHPEDLRNVREKIADYDLPEGYQEQFGVDLLDYQLISLTGPTENCHIYLLQAPKDAELSLEDLQKQLESLEGGRMPANRHDRRDVRVVETRTVTLGGQDVPLVVGEGINSNEQPYREVTAVFEGRSGPALVNISSPSDLWNWDLVNKFLASID